MSKSQPKTQTSLQQREEIDEARGAEIEIHPGAAPFGTDAEAGAEEDTSAAMKVARMAPPPASAKRD